MNDRWTKTEDIELTKHLIDTYMHDLRVLTSPAELREWVAECLNREFGGYGKFEKMIEHKERRNG